MVKEGGKKPNPGGRSLLEIMTFIKMQSSFFNCVFVVCVWDLLNKVIMFTVNQDVYDSPSKVGKPNGGRCRSYFSCVLYVKKKQLGAIVIIISDTQPTYAVFWTAL